MSADTFPVLRAVCSWCGTLIREGVEPISHGMCPPCADKMLEQIRARKEAKCR